MSSLRSGSSSTTRILAGGIGTPVGQRDDEFGERPRVGLHDHLAAVAADDDVVADREAQTGALACGLGRKERFEDFGTNALGNAVAVVAEADLDAPALERARADADAAARA